MSTQSGGNRAKGKQAAKTIGWFNMSGDEVRQHVCGDVLAENTRLKAELELCGKAHAAVDDMWLDAYQQAGHYQEALREIIEACDNDLHMSQHRDPSWEAVNAMVRIARRALGEKGEE